MLQRIKDELQQISWNRAVDKAPQNQNNRGETIHPAQHSRKCLSVDGLRIVWVNSRRGKGGSSVVLWQQTFSFIRRSVPFCQVEIIAGST